ncbi:beta-lactamase/transpeptidase-like protein [Aspergillus pseudodeflectus]|uniref:Beta-lactamase/transpeptidase-like protein n=1 Tax=Aspergillus pseudodeflectus TaxID=176178 RepID=A0ABR4JJZ0_9EURO
MDEKQAATQHRLSSCLAQIQQIFSTCQTPSITLGVVHHGRVIMKNSIGHRDSELALPANENTIYMLGSCSKMFTSAAVGILVDEGKLSWTDRIQKHLPEFNPEGDPRIGQEADIIDCFRHTTGLASPMMLTVGPRGTIASDPEDLIAILNAMPTRNGNGEQRFNREWLYNNAAVGLMALIVERVSGQRFADFVRERILEPLGMTRTAMTRTDIENDDNIAAPCTKLSNGRFYHLPDSSWPCDEHSPLLAGMGIRSSLSDMLTWCIAVLDAERSEKDPSYKRTVPNNPLKHMTRVRRGYWTRPADDPDFSKPAAYGMGWFRIDLPSSKLSSFGGNALSQGKEHQCHLDYILGKEEAPSPLTAVGHTGGMRGSVFSVYTFPETQSAVVTATNGRDLGDASDFTAQILIQALFDLKPVVDLLPWAKKEAELAAGFYREHVEAPWEENRRPNDRERDRLIYVGDYRGFNDRFTLSVVASSQPSGPVSLAVIFNHRPASKCPLIFYQTDVYSFFQPDEDYTRTRVIIAREHKQMLLKFQVDEGGAVEGLWWQWDIEAEPGWLQKVSR